MLRAITRIARGKKKIFMEKDEDVGFYSLRICDSSLQSKRAFYNDISELIVGFFIPMSGVR